MGPWFKNKRVGEVLFSHILQPIAMGSLPEQYTDIAVGGCPLVHNKAGEEALANAEACLQQRVIPPVSIHQLLVVMTACPMPELNSFFLSHHP